MEKNILLAIAGIAILFLCYLIVSGKPDNADASQWPSSIAPVELATSTVSQAVTAGTVELLFASSTCSTRVIGTQGSEIRLTFRDTAADRPTALVGFSQAASTTVAYDAERFGCGAVYVYPYGTGNLSVMEYR